MSRTRLRYFIVVRASDLRRFASSVHQEYFSKPVEVFPVYSQVSTRLMYVSDPNHPTQPERPFPVDVESGVIKTFHQLTSRQRKAAGL